MMLRDVPDVDVNARMAVAPPHTGDDWHKESAAPNWCAVALSTGASLDLVVVDLHKSFDGTTVLSDITFTISHGQAVALIGASGSGKSTLLRCCLRLIEPDRGAIRFFGEEVSRLAGRGLRRVRSQVGLVFQRHNLVPRLSVLSNVLHGALARSAGPRVWFHSLARGQERARAWHCLDLVGLAHLAERRADQLSGGESQPVAIARALMQAPRLVLADEPVASLDPKAGEEVLHLFVDLMRREGVTVFFTTHHLEHALRYADHVLALRGGRLVLDAPSTALDLERLRGLYV